MGFQSLLCPVGLNLLHMPVGILDASELDDEVRGGLLSDPRHAGNIVRRIPHQSLQLDDLKGRHLIPIDDVLSVVVLCLRHTALALRNPDPDMLSGKLQKIPITGQHRHLQPSGLAALRHGTQQIVRLQSRLFHGLDAHGMEHVLQHRHLLMELRRHGLSGPLVSLVHFMPKSRCLHIKSHRQIVRLFLVQHLK